MAVLSIDAGTTGVTVMLVDERGDVIGRGYREFPQSFPRPGWVEHDPEAWWSATVAAATDALRSRGPETVEAVGITNQRETTVIWERDTLRPVHPAIVWQDRRTAPMCEELVEEGGTDRGAGARHRSHQRVPDDAVRHPKARLGPRPPGSPTHPPGPPSGDTSVVGSLRDRRARRIPRHHGADLRGGRRPAGRPGRSGLLRGRRRQEHLRHRLVRPAEHGHRGPPRVRSPHYRGLLGPRGRAIRA